MALRGIALEPVALGSARARLRCAIVAVACACHLGVALVDAPSTVWQAGIAEGAAVLIADFTGDGCPDILCGRREGLRLLHRSGSGAFAEIPAALSGPADSIVALVAADADGDGDLDVFQLDAQGPGRLLKNQGNGIFPAADERGLPPTAGSATAAAAADLDGDGDADLLVGQRGSQPLWLRNDNTVFRAVSLGVALPQPATVQVAVAAVNADPWSDVVLFDRDAGVIILLNQGSGVFALSAASQPAAPVGLRSGALADVDGDGDADLLGAGATGAFLWLNQGDGSFVAATSFPMLAAAIFAVLPCDLDVDGDLDLYLACAGQDQVLLNDGHGVFSDTPALVPVNEGRSFAAAVGDVNGDLAPDVAVAVPDGPDRLLLGAFAAPVIRLEAPPQAVVGRAFSVRVAAADPDGVQSLVLTANGEPLAIVGEQAACTPVAAGPVEFVATARDTLGHVASVGPRRTLVLANLPPVVTAGPNLRLLVNEPLAVSGQVTDPGSSSWSGVVSYGDGTAAATLALEADGRFALAHAYGLPGVFAVTVSVTDEGGAVGQAAVMATVVNQAPYLARIQDQGVQAGQAFRAIALDDLLTDPDNEAAEIAWAITGNAQLGVSLSPLRVVTISYAPGTACCERLQFTATDPAGASATRHAFFVVGAPGTDRLPPVALLDAEPPTVEAGQPALLRARIEDADGVVTLVRLFGPDAAEVELDLAADGSYSASYPTRLPGVLAFELVAVDAQGNLFTDLAEVHVVDPTREASLTVSLTAPTDDATVSGPVTVRGTVQCRELLEYRLETAPVGSSTYTIFASGSANAYDETLGTFDPAALENGFHRLRLIATNAAGRTAQTEIVVMVDDQRKIGLFTLSFDDKVVSVGGPRLAITRTYDSRRKRRGDFGYGWDLGFGNIYVLENRLPDSGWRQWNNGSFWPVYDLTATVPHFATVVLNQDDMHRFEAMPYPRRGVTWPVRYLDVMEYLPQDGATGEIIPSPQPFYTSNGIGAVDIWDQEYRRYRPRTFTYTADNGWVYRFERESNQSLRHRLTSYSDPNGVTTHVLPGGLLRDDGTSILFARDAQDRIISVTDPAGAVIRYDYSLRGDLVAVTNELGGVTRFGYDRHHNLVEVIDPAGNRATRNEYDENGRLVAVIDAAGRRLEFAHDTEGRRELVRDRVGGLWVLEYNEDGYTTAITDPLDHTYRFTYDARGNRLSETDPDGRTRTYVYDAEDRKTAETDPEGHTARWTYDSAGRILSHSDFAGHTESRTYGPSGNLLTLTDAGGNTTTCTYDSSGNRTSRTDALGNTTLFEYGAGYRLTRVTDALGRRTEFAYDDAGRRTLQRQTWTGPAGPLPVSRAFTYNLRGLPESRGDWLGKATRREYTPAGQPSAFIDRLGRRTEMVYDALGRPSERHFPDGTMERNEYDAEGRLVARTDRAGRRRSFEYDARSRITRTLHPDGTETRNEYDRAGRLVRTIDAAGRATTTTYDDAGRVAAVTDALGHASAYAYDASGNLTAVTEPNGNTTTFEYDALNRRTQSTYPDGSTESTAYDALGRIAAKTDRAGSRTSFTYDVVGNLSATTDAAGGVTRFAYDELGYLVAVTTPKGQTVTYERDAQGRAVRTTLPLGMSQEALYNAEGNLVGRTTYAGDQFTYAYDSDDRLLSRALADGGPEERFEYLPTGELLSASGPGGSLACTYDSMGRLLRYEAGAGGAVTYTYDAVGNVASMTSPSGVTTYAHDALNRLAGVTAPDGAAVAYAYDTAGCLRRAEYSNGVVTQREWLAGRLTRLEHRGPGSALLAAYEYGYDAAGRQTSVRESPSGTVVTYAYDALSRLVSETLEGAGVPRSIVYAYDSNGNRVSRSDSAGTSDVYTYDANDRMTAAGPRLCGYDASGRLLSEAGPDGPRTYTWDVFGRLVSLADGAVTVTYAYDPLDQRVDETVNGAQTTRFLYDILGLSQVVRTTDGAGTETAAYTHGLGPLFLHRGGTTQLCLADAQRNTRLLLGPAGTVTDTLQVDAFGRSLARTGVTPLPFQYRGEWRDAHSGLDYLRARWLDPEDGRFASTDPVAGQPMLPGSYNPYAYAQGNPIGNSDPTGCTTLGELMAGNAAGSALASIALTHMTFAILSVQIIDALIKPGFAMRYGACELMAHADNYQIQQYAMKIYDHGNTMIAFATDLIALTKNVLEMANTFAGLGSTVNGIAAGQTSAAELAKDPDSYKMLLDMNSSLNAVDGSFLTLARSMEIKDAQLMAELEGRAEGLAQDIEKSLGTVSTVLGYYKSAKGFAKPIKEKHDEAKEKSPHGLP